jgi:hypothetical protein
MMSSSMTLIFKTQTLCPNGITWCGSKEKGYILLSTLICACCIFGDFVFDLTIRYMYYSIHFQHLIKLCCFYVMLMFKFMQYTKMCLNSL